MTEHNEQGSPSDAFGQLAGLLAIVSNPKATEARLKELQAVTKAQAHERARLDADREQLDADRLAFAQEMEAGRAEIAEGRAIWVARQTRLNEREQGLQRREESVERRWQSMPPRFRGVDPDFIAIEGTTISRAISESDEEPGDPHFGSAPRSMPELSDETFGASTLRRSVEPPARVGRRAAAASRV